MKTKSLLSTASLALVIAAFSASAQAQIAIGLIIIAFLMFEPDGLAHRWRQIKTYWKLYPFSH